MPPKKVQHLSVKLPGELPKQNLVQLDLLEILRHCGVTRYVKGLNVHPDLPGQLLLDVVEKTK